MDLSASVRRFSDDQRAVSAVIGFILIFGILMITLTVYQAQIVPQQNAQTEFKDFEETRDELIDLRNSISTAGQAGLPQFPSVRLGTSYQSRILTINPASPTGTLQTEQHDIIIENGTDPQQKISTRFIEYQPGYNEIEVGSTWYENSVLYLDTPDRNNTIIEEQNLVIGGNELRITALQKNITRTGTSRTTISLDNTQSNTYLDEFSDTDELTFKIPTRLNEDYWRTLEDDAPEMYDRVETDDEINRLVVTTTKENVSINTVGAYS